MDRFGYRQIGEEGGVLPKLRLMAMASRYDLGLGEWAGAGLGDVYWKRDPFTSTMLRHVTPSLQVEPTGTTCGHNTMRDDNFSAVIKCDRDVPISPLFVRDLCGRVVYIGFGPDRKTSVDWEAYVPRKPDGTVIVDLLNPFLMQVVFPRYCRDVAKMEGKELIEEVFLTKFRSLEPGSDFCYLPSGATEDTEATAVLYEGANLFPYKLRLDTFYTDGWRLPQTQMVFARSEEQEVDPVRAKNFGEEMLEKWRTRTPGQKYEDWLLEIGGKGQVELWFERGMTLIPTFEACNGLTVVGDDFSIQDYWPGRAVDGLHEVMEARASDAPEGTILQVMKPGFVTARHIERAQVVVSDGSGYVSPHVDTPAALIPNLHLPHPRTCDDWGAVWLPTHPEHFEYPALWGWDADTGRFLQMRGPIWDPLHYYYESVDEVLRAFETPMSDEENRWLVRVPEHMRDRFYPVVELKGFDTFSIPEQTRREAARILPQSMIKRVGKAVSAGIGYHPLPLEFEYELEPLWFPDLNPLNREHDVCPESLSELVVSVTKPEVEQMAFLQSIETDEAHAWLRDVEFLYDAGEDALQTYPFLARYLLPELPMEAVYNICTAPYLLSREKMLDEPYMLWWADANGEMRDRASDFTQFPGLRDNLWEARQKGSDLVKFRHLFYQQNGSLFLMAYWTSAAVPLMDEMYTNWISSATTGGVMPENKPVMEPDASLLPPQRPVAEQPVGLPEEPL